MRRRSCQPTWPLASIWISRFCNSWLLSKANIRDNNSCTRFVGCNFASVARFTSYGNYLRKTWLWNGNPNDWQRLYIYYFPSTGIKMRWLVHSSTRANARQILLRWKNCVSRWVGCLVWNFPTDWLDEGEWRGITALSAQLAVKSRVIFQVLKMIN